MPQYGEQESRTAQFDFSQGIVGKISETGLPVSARRFGRRPYIRMVRQAINAIFRPRRAISVRGGTHDTSAAALLEPPHSLARYYSPGANKTFAFTDSGSNNGKAWEDTTTAYTQYTAPYSLTSQWVSHVDINGVCMFSQMGGSQSPFFWAAQPANPATTFLTCTLPAPVTTPTFNADGAGGDTNRNDGATPRSWYYRVRWLYQNGASLAGPPSAAHAAPVAGSGNYITNIKADTALIPASPRADWIGWQLERTWLTGSQSLGPWRVVWTGTATTYGSTGTAITGSQIPDNILDSGLFNLVDDTQYGSPPHVEGIVEYRGRIFGWNGSNLYYSQPLAIAAPAGVFNFVGNSIIVVGSNDGDAIVGCVSQSGRLVIGKQRSVWTLEGDDPSNFRLTQRYAGAGFASMRSAATVGTSVFFAAGNGRLFAMHGNSVVPFAVDEMGEYLDNMDTSVDSQIVVRNYNGQFLVVQHRQIPDTLGNGDSLVYDLQEKCWSHWSGYYASDILVQKDSQDVLLADPVLRQPVNVSGFATNPSFLVWTYNGAARAIGVNNADGSIKSGWSASGTVVGAGTSTPSYTATCGDGSGNVFVLTIEPRATITTGIYVQKFNASGAAQWTAGGVAVIAAPDSNSHVNPLMVADGSGGCVVAWQDTTAILCKAQRLDSTGAALWTANGVPIMDGTTSMNTSRIPTLHLDGSGGCYYTWGGGNLTDDRLYLQRLTLAAGARQFTVKGVPVSSVSTNASSSRACRDGLGNILIAQYIAVPGFQPTGIQVFKYNNAGALVWTSANLDSTISSRGASNLRIVPDGLGGAFVFWTAWRPPATSISEVYVNTVNSSGAIGGTTGVQLSAGATTSGVISTSFNATADGAGGAIVAWTYATSSNVDLVMAQRVNGSRVPQWTTNGVTIGTQTSSGPLWMNTDGAGGAVIFWCYSNNYPILAQRINAAGLPVWTAGGVLYESNSTGNASGFFSAFTDTPQGEYVPGAGAGYHVWSGFTGFLDQRALDGSGGVPIQWGVTTHPIDDATPDQFKDFERIEAHVPTGSAQLGVSLVFDDGVTPFSTQLSAGLAALTYNDSGGTGNLVYDDSTTPAGTLLYPQSSEIVQFTGIPRGTLARRYTFSVAASLAAAFVFAGYVIHSLILPRRDFS